MQKDNTQRDRFPPALLEEASILINQLRPVKGEKRVVYRCDCEGCGKLHAVRFIPFGLGRGVSINKCMCQLTANRTHMLTKIMEVSP